jgi:hypothetical protein
MAGKERWLKSMNFGVVKRFQQERDFDSLPDLNGIIIFVPVTCGVLVNKDEGSHRYSEELSPSIEDGAFYGSLKKIGGRDPRVAPKKDVQGRNKRVLGYIQDSKKAKGGSNKSIGSCRDEIDNRFLFDKFSKGDVDPFYSMFITNVSPMYHQRVGISSQMDNSMVLKGVTPRLLSSRSLRGFTDNVESNMKKGRKSAGGSHSHIGSNYTIKEDSDSISSDLPNEGIAPGKGRKGGRKNSVSLKPWGPDGAPIQ